MQKYDLTYSFFELNLNSYLLYISVCIAITVLAMSVFRLLISKKFRSGWRSAIWIILPAFFLIPFKFKMPFTKIPLFAADFLLYIYPFETPEYLGVSELRSYGGQGAEGITFGEVFIWVWLAVAVISAAYQVVRLAALNKKIKRRGIVCKSAGYKNILDNICSEMKLKAPEVIIFPEADTPFAVGILKPKIILPSQEYSEEEIDFIFRHEAIHIKRKDILMKLIMIIFRSVNWFNPFAYLMCRQVFEDMEITCDERATADFSEEQRECYSKTILKGISKSNYPAVTTYLSTNAKTLKKRISSVMTVKKLGIAIPLAVMLPVMFFLTGTVYASDTSSGTFSGAWYGYLYPYPLEYDPYVTSEEWKTCEAYNSEDAARKFFDRYMRMYMGDDVPDYLRVENYYITDVEISGEHKLADLKEHGLMWGVFNRNIIADIHYNVEFANKCGNTAHNINGGSAGNVNGAAEFCHLGFDMNKKGKVYTVNNIGAGMFFYSGPYHFRNELTREHGTLENLELMAKSGLLDKSWNTSDDLPDAEALLKASYPPFRKLNPNNDYYIGETPNLFFGIKVSADYLKRAECVDNETGRVTSDNFTYSDAGVEYCGYDYDVITGNYVIYANVTGEAPHGVMLDFKHIINTYTDTRRSSSSAVLVSVTVTDKLFTPVEYHDSFDNIPLPDSLNSAEELLEYMKIPRDGCDFTVLDYRNITEENGGVYAEVKFKGRLDGTYSSDLMLNDRITNKPVSDGYIRVRVI